MDTMPMLLTVFGATGQQGCALIDYVLHHPKLSSMYTLRGITRDITKPAAATLTGKGVEMVKADMDDEDGLKKAVAGSHAVFAMTNYWDHGSALREVAQGKAIADAAIAMGVKLIIWSSLPNVTRMTGGKLTKVHHFDSKAKVEEYMRGLDILSVFFLPGFFMQNTETLLKPQPNTATGEVEYLASFPATVSLPLFDTTDTGKFIAPMLLSQETNPKKYQHATLIAGTAYYSGTEMVDTWSRVTGRKVTYKEMEGNSAYPGLTDQMKEVMKEASDLMRDCEYYGPTGREGLKWTLAQMDDKLITFESYVKRVEEGAKGGWFG